MPILTVWRSSSTTSVLSCDAVVDRVAAAFAGQREPTRRAAHAD